MELERVDTQRAYELILAKITTLELAPGAAINEQKLAQELNMGAVPVREALKLLAHDSLVVVTPRHGLYVADVSQPDLEQISELRLSLESLCARLAAQRATDDDLVVLEALRQEQAARAEVEADMSQASPRLFELDHKFHQAVAQAAHNRYLARTLDQFYGLSQRLWYLALPALGFLPAAVEKHLDLVEAIKAGDANRAEQVMYDHVKEFYDRVREVLVERGMGTKP
jgi:DNA-binding GntR family transcriptional regulator